jgi:S-methylmethionine-dependent homocysteine/selenocysteine methylase
MSPTPARTHLPQLDHPVFLTDGGIETTLIFHDGFELPDFAAFTLLDTANGTRALNSYFAPYAEIAVRERVGVVLETATWRANTEWGARLGYDPQRLAEINVTAVSMLAALRDRYETTDTPVVISGCVGPRGDGYRPEVSMSPEEAEDYHRPQAQAFAVSHADLVTAITMTYSGEAIGVTRAATAAGMPVVISFTVETDGRLPSGETLREAIEATDAATGSGPTYYMINCAHPSHFDSVLASGGAWVGRIRGLRANASTLSHAELDEAEELDGGDPVDLGRRYRELRDAHPQLTVVGGCCGTNHEHIDAIAGACRAGAR